MYSQEQRSKAVELYVRYGHHAAAVLRELGYPKSAWTLALWYKEFEESGKLHGSYRTTSKYTPEQRMAAVKHYLEHGKCCSYTCQELGYPSRTLLKEWVMEDAPEAVSSCCRTGSALVNLSLQQKEQAVIDLCSHTATAQEIADRYGVTRGALYGWKRQLLDEGEPAAMTGKPIDTTSAEPLTDDPEELRSEVNRLRQKTSDLQKQTEDLQKEAEDLQKQVYRLRMERDVLEKAAEIIKKDQGVSLNTLTNREKAIVIDALKDRYPVKDLLSVFHMAKSSYYYQESVFKAPDKYADMREKVREEFSASGGCYGYRRIHRGLRNNGTTVSEKVVLRIMQEENLVVVGRKHRKYSSYKGEISPAVPNVIDRDFHADKPNEKWLTDITEFHIPAGKVYLSPMIDCFDGLPVSWTIGTSPDAELVNTMLDAAIQTLNEDEHPIVTFRSRMPLPMARLDRAYGSSRSYEIHVEERLLTGQFSL